MPTDPIRIV